MTIDILKLCADKLRANVSLTGGAKLKATHAHELVAGFFGYKSRAALLADTAYPLSDLGEAAVLCPNVALMDARRGQLEGLPVSLATSREIAAFLFDVLKDQKHFAGELWLCDSLGEFIMEVFLPANDSQVMDELSGVMAETNARFDEAYYEGATMTQDGESIVIHVSGAYYGSNHPDKPFSGDTVGMNVTVTLPRVAGHVAFGEPDLDVGGRVNDDWVDPDLSYGTAE